MKGKLKLNLKQLKIVMEEDIKYIPMLTQNNSCSKCGLVSMSEYEVYADKKSMEIIIIGKCSKCGKELERVIQDENKKYSENLKKLLEEKKVKMEEKKENLDKKEIYRLKVELKGIRPPIWRRVLVESDITFYELHIIIQEVMGWENYHMYQFIIGRKNYIVDEEDDMDGVYGANIKTSRELKLKDVMTEEKQKIDYEYDFGDGWEHRIILESIEESEKKKKYPICIAGKRACPPEDVGGVMGYEHLLEVIKDPEHEDYEEMIQFSGENFDPEEFNIEDINEMLDLMIE